MGLYTHLTWSPLDFTFQDVWLYVRDHTIFFITFKKGLQYSCPEENQADMTV